MHPFRGWFTIQWIFLAIFSESFRLSQRLSWGIGKWFGEDCSISSIVSQYALGIFHVWGVILSGSAHAYRDWLGVGGPSFESWVIWFSLTYFVVDSMVILLIDLKNQAFFLIHHAVAFSIGYACLLGISGVTETSQYILVLEMSNVALTVWDLVKRYRPKNPGVLVPAYKFITPIFMFTYVPLRTIALPIVTWNLYRSITTPSLTIHVLFSSCIVFILGISYKFSLKVASIGLRVTKESYPYILSFASLTYIFKAYVSLAWFFIVTPSSPFHEIPFGIAVLVTDAVSIMASLNYSSFGERPSLEATAFDYSAVCAKIVVNGVYIHAIGSHTHSSHDVHASLIWLLAIMISIGILVVNLYKLYASSSKKQNRQRIFDMFAKRRMPWSYVLLFILCTCVPMAIMGGYGSIKDIKGIQDIQHIPYAPFGLYLTGGIVWWGVGAMHMFMTLADAALLSWNARP